MSIPKDLANKFDAAFRKYSLWLANNPSLSKEVEVGVKLSSYILINLVDRGDTDAIHQVVYCFSDLISFLNDFALSRAYPDAGLPYGNNLKTWLTVVEYCEVCLELGAQKAWGTRGKWVVVALVQLFKSVCRVALLKKNEGLLPFPPIPPLRREAVSEMAIAADRRTDVAYRLSSGVVIRRIEGGSSFNELSQMGGEPYKNLMADDKPYVFKGAALVGEILYCVKPLVHLGAMGVTGRLNWLQWVTSLTMEVVSLRLQYDDYVGRRYSDKQEWQYVSRQVSLLVYLFRSPFYDKNVKFALLSVLLGLRRIFPFLKFILNPCIEFLPAWQETYFYLWSH